MLGVHLWRLAARCGDERGISGSAEHQVVVRPGDGSETIFILACLMLAQCLDSFGGQRDGASAGLRLRLPESWRLVLDSDQIATDCQRATFEIHIGPSKSQQLTFTQTRVHG